MNFFRRKYWFSQLINFADIGFNKKQWNASSNLTYTILFPSSKTVPFLLAKKQHTDPFWTFHFKLLTFNLWKNVSRNHEQNIQCRPHLDYLPGSQYNDSIFLSYDVIILIDDDSNITGSTNQVFCTLSPIRGPIFVNFPIIFTHSNTQVFFLSSR